MKGGEKPHHQRATSNKDQMEQIEIYTHRMDIHRPMPTGEQLEQMETNKDDH